MKPIIKIQDLGKRYRIGARPRHRTLRESAVDICAGALRGVKSLAMGHKPISSDLGDEHIWALRDLNFDIMPGQVLGVIGSNGAGKSTLLKLLARITEPTTGRIELYGRLGSLLEVGTGFHAELTGRENIYLSAAILGMRRAEIERKFDEIVAFAEVEKFIDTPVKHYSSGMYVRLAFAVAAHLEPEVLLVDEVLAVGDLAFQKKCIDKMGDVARGGRTIVFVSHNVASIESLCDSCILLAEGRLVSKGSPSDVIGEYISSQVVSGSGQKSLISHPGRRAHSEPTMNSVTLFSGSRTPVNLVRMGAPLSIAVEFLRKTTPWRPVLGLVVKTTQGWAVFGINNRFVGAHQFQEPLQQGTITCTIDSLPLTPGTYVLDLYLGDYHQDFDAVSEAITFEVVPSDVFGTGRLPPPGVGVIYLPAAWTLSDIALSAPSAFGMSIERGDGHY